MLVRGGAGWCQVGIQGGGWCVQGGFQVGVPGGCTSGVYLAGVLAVPGLPSPSLARPSPARPSLA